MSKKPALHPRQAVGHSLREVALDILGEIRTTLQAPPRADAVTIHDVRKALKRWRALLRLLPLGDDKQRLRLEARDLARALGSSRDAQSALDALNDLLEDKKEDNLSARSIETITSRLEEIRRSNERSQLNTRTRTQLSAWVASTEAEVALWPLDDLTFAEVAESLAAGYARARRRIPDNWSLATPEQIHELRQRIVEHRYQMELVEPLWPRMGGAWVDEAQRIRTRLGKYQDLTLLIRLAEPHQPLAPWRSRLSPLIAQGQGEHVAVGARMATRMFAESRKAFRKRLEALWDASSVKAAISARVAPLLRFLVICTNPRSDL
jgi:CHAD domain-containing protein